MPEAADHNAQDREQEVRTCSIPRAMMLEIIRKQDLEELEFHLKLWESGDDRDNETAYVQDLKDRIAELKSQGTK
jgi:hypothetical protein